MDLFPHTGRTHQLRRHCAQQLKCPILGDTQYGARTANAPFSNDAGASGDVASAALGCFEATTPACLPSRGGAPPEPRVAALSGSGLFLAAVELALAHPCLSGQPMRWRVDEPPKFGALRQREQARYDRLAPDQPPS